MSHLTNNTVDHLGDESRQSIALVMTTKQYSNNTQKPKQLTYDKLALVKKKHIKTHTKETEAKPTGRV